MRKNNVLIILAILVIVLGSGHFLSVLRGSYFNMDSCDDRYAIDKTLVCSGAWVSTYEQDVNTFKADDSSLGNYIDNLERNYGFDYSSLEHKQCHVTGSVLVYSRRDKTSETVNIDKWGNWHVWGEFPMCVIPESGKRYGDDYMLTYNLQVVYYLDGSEHPSSNPPPVNNLLDILLSLWEQLTDFILSLFSS